MKQLDYDIECISPGEAAIEPRTYTLRFEHNPRSVSISPNQQTSWVVKARDDIEAVEKAKEILPGDKASMSRARLLGPDGLDVMPWWPAWPPRSK